MRARCRTRLEQLADVLANLLAVRRCLQCGGKMAVEHFHPPIYMKDGISGVRAKCSTCGHVELLFCRNGP